MAEISVNLTEEAKKEEEKVKRIKPQIGCSCGATFESGQIKRHENNCCHRTWAEGHKNEVKEKEKEAEGKLLEKEKKFTCPCGGCYTGGQKNKHERSKKHVGWMALITEGKKKEEEKKEEETKKEEKREEEKVLPRTKCGCEIEYYTHQKKRHEESIWHIEWAKKKEEEQERLARMKRNADKVREWRKEKKEQRKRKEKEKAEMDNWIKLAAEEKKEISKEKREKRIEKEAKLFEAVEADCINKFTEGCISRDPELYMCYINEITKALFAIKPLTYTDESEKNISISMSRTNICRLARFIESEIARKSGYRGDEKYAERISAYIDKLKSQSVQENIETVQELRTALHKRKLLKFSHIIDCNSLYSHNANIARKVNKKLTYKRVNVVCTIVESSHFVCNNDTKTVYTLILIDKSTFDETTNQFDAIKAYLTFPGKYELLADSLQPGNAIKLIRAIPILKASGTGPFELMPGLNWFEDSGVVEVFEPPNIQNIFRKQAEPEKSHVYMSYNKLPDNEENIWAVYIQKNHEVIDLLKENFELKKKLDFGVKSIVRHTMRNFEDLPEAIKLSNFNKKYYTQEAEVINLGKMIICEKDQEKVARATLEYDSMYKKLDSCFPKKTPTYLRTPEALDHRLKSLKRRHESIAERRQEKKKKLEKQQHQTVQPQAVQPQIVYNIQTQNNYTTNNYGCQPNNQADNQN